MNSLLIQPIATEKSTTSQKTGKYTFLVERRASKIELKKAIQSLYKVDVTKINMIGVKTKTRYGAKQRLITKRFALKKAVITLKTGQSIDVNKFKDKK